MCLRAERLEQCIHTGVNFFALLQSRATRASHSPLFGCCNLVHRPPTGRKILDKHVSYCTKQALRFQVIWWNGPKSAHHVNTEFNFTCKKRNGCHKFSLLTPPLRLFVNQKLGAPCGQSLSVTLRVGTHSQMWTKALRLETLWKLMYLIQVWT